MPNEDLAQDGVPDCYLKARAALSDLSARLLALSENWSGEMAAEARLARLLSTMPLGSPRSLYDALELARGLEMFIDNWRDCAKPRRGADPEGRGDAGTQRERYESASFTISEYAAHHLEDEHALEALAVAKWLKEFAAPLPREEQPSKRDVEEEAIYDGYVQPAADAAARAVEALCALVDAVTP